MENNPYSSPAANLFGSVSETSAQGVSEPVLLQLKRTKPWVRLISVCCLILGILMLLAAVGMAIAGASAFDSKAPAAVGGVVAIIYAVMGLLIYIYPGVKMWKFANRIATLLTRRSDEDLIAALDQQRSIWKYSGILALLLICIMVLAILASLAVPVFNAIQSSAAGQ